MTIFSHCGQTFPRELQILQIQWHHSNSAVVPDIEKYKSYNIHDYIWPLRKKIL